MTENRNGKGAIPALIRVASIFTVDFIINFAWSIVVIIVFSMIKANMSNSVMSSGRMLDEIARSPEYLFLTSIYNVFIIAITFLFWKYVDKSSTEVIGLKWRRNSVKMFGLGIVGGTFEILLIILLSLGLGTLWFQNYGSTIFSNTEMLRSLFYGVLAFLLVGFGEEALFRGYIQKRLMLEMGNKWALIISSLVFMAAHILTYGKLLDFIDVALGGAVLGYLYILTDSLYLPAAYHFIYDLLQVNIVRIQDYEYYKGAVMYAFGNTGDVVISGVNFGNVIEISFIIVELTVLLLLYTFRNKIRDLAN